MPRINNNIKQEVAGFAAVIVFVLALNSVSSLWAASTQPELLPRFELGTPPGMVNRSRKGDRTRSFPATETALPIGCDSPVSSLAKPLPKDFTARCLT
jgi:hypothetical protein